MNRTTQILILILVVLLGFLLYNPEPEYKDAPILGLSRSQLKQISYVGLVDWQADAKQEEDRKRKVEYSFEQTLNRYTPYFITLKNLETIKRSSLQEKKLAKFIQQKPLKIPGGRLLDTVFLEISSLKAISKFTIPENLKSDPEKKDFLKKYGLDSCKNYFTTLAEGEGDSRKFCIGKANYSKAHTYLYDPGKNWIYVVHQYMISRLQKNPLSYFQKKLGNFTEKDIEKVEVHLNKKYQDSLPILFKKTNGTFSTYSVVEKKPQPSGKEAKVTVYKFDRFAKLPSFLAQPILRIPIDFQYHLPALLLQNDLPAPDLTVVVFWKNKAKPLTIRFYKQYPENTISILPVGTKENLPPRAESHKKVFIETDFVSGVQYLIEWENTLRKFENMEKELKREQELEKAQKAKEKAKKKKESP